MIELPDTARLKMAALERAAADARALAEAAKAECDQLDVEGGRFMHAAKVASGQRDAAGIEAINGELARIRKALDAAQASHLTRRNRASMTAATVTAVKSWLQQLRPDRILEPVEIESLDLKGEMPAAALTRVRSRILGLQVERSEVEATPPTLDELRQQAAQIVAEMGARGRPFVAVHGGKLTADLYGRRSAVDVLAAMFPSAMVKLIESGIPNENSAAMTVEERRTRLGAIKKQFDQAERAEEQLVVMCAASGIAVDRRIDASPAAILGIAVRKVRAAAA